MGPTKELGSLREKRGPEGKSSTSRAWYCRSQGMKKVFGEGSTEQSAEDTELTIRSGKLEGTGDLAQDNFHGGWTLTCNGRELRGEGAQEPQPRIQQNHEVEIRGRHNGTSTESRKSCQGQPISC